MDSSGLVKIKSIYNTTAPKTELTVKIKNDFNYDCTDFDVEIFADKSDASKTSVVAKKNETTFAGACSDSVCQNYLMIVNKKKKRAKLLPIDVCDLSEVNDKKSSNIVLPDLNRYDKRVLLSDKFGSKRSKRKTELGMRMRVNAEACELQLKPIVDETQIDASYLEDMDDGTDSLERLIPRCNRFASTPQGVYNLNDLLGEDERMSLKEAAESLIENPPCRGDTGYSSFLIEHYRLISKNVDWEKVAILLYADCLLRLFKMHPRELKQRDSWNSVCLHSKLIISKLKMEFTDSKMVTVFMKHKIICHILVAILLACNLSVYLELISSCFSGIDSKKLLQICRLVGVTPQSKSSSGVLVLKVPLPPLPTSRSPKKKRR